MHRRKIILILALALLTACTDISNREGISTNVVPVFLQNGGSYDDDILQETRRESIETSVVTSTVAPYSAEEMAAALADTTELDESIDEVFDRHNAVGMSLAVFAGGEIIYTRSLGYASVEDGIAATDETKYRSASISKTVTALCAMTLKDEAKLDTNAAVSSILGIQCEENAAFPNTVRNLMTHTSTILDTAAYEAGVAANPPPSLESVLISGGFDGVRPGERYAYSNFAFGIMGAVAEQITGERFYSFADRVLFDKTGMDAGYMRTLINDARNIADIYVGGELSQSVRTWARTETYYDRYPIGGQYAMAQCELIISAPDLARVGIILAGDGTLDGTRIISEESLAEMRTPYITVEEDGYTVGHGYGLRMCEDIVSGRTITGHPGQAYGMVGGLYFDTMDGTGVAILTNGCSAAVGEAGMYEINYDIVTAVYDYFF